MPLFAGQPAGVQIKRWLVILVVLLVAIDLFAATSLVVVQRSMVTIEERYQPILISASEISTEIHRAQAALYKYLGEYLPDTSEAEAHTAALGEALEGALAQKGSGEWEPQIRAISENLAKYRVVIRNLPSIGGVTDWEQVNELRGEAMELGRLMESQTSELKEEVGTRIRLRTMASVKLSRTALVIFLFFFALSVLITFLLYLWWGRFQEMILNL